MDIYDIHDDYEQQNDEIKRLQEMTEIVDESDQDEDEVKVNELLGENLDLFGNQNNLFNVADWSWNLSRPNRLVAAAQLIRLVCEMCKRFNNLIIEKDLHRARINCAEAGALSFRNARIVGSTVVGASRRLDAIRSAGPFAVVIEEACEVLEPTLISVLAVNTLKKLEMIGDHRQLNNL